MVKGTGHAAGQDGKGRIFKRGGRVWWIQYYIHGQQVRESSHSDKKAVAEKLLMKRLVAADEGTLTAPTRPITYEEMRERLGTSLLPDPPPLTRQETSPALPPLNTFF